MSRLCLQSTPLCAPGGSEGHPLRGGAVLNVLHTSVANSVCYQSRKPSHLFTVGCSLKTGVLGSIYCVKSQERKNFTFMYVRMSVHVLVKKQVHLVLLFFNSYNFVIIGSR